MKAKHCDECANEGPYFPDNEYKFNCLLGHKPRFYQPRSPYPHDGNDWGWKRKCEDFKEKAK